MTANQPAYNLKAVIHETGLTPATLRAWERRYGVPRPQRSSGGHRLYTLEEIEMLKWLVARQSEGLSISQAIELWRSQGRLPPARIASSRSPRVESGSTITMLDQLREEWIAACLAFDEPAAELALSQSLALAAPEVVTTEMLQKALAELGEGWYAGKVSVQQEHFASALAARRLNALLAAAPPPSRPARLLAACPPGEMHDLALLMLAFSLRWQGWDVVYLGANVPLDRMAATLQSARPRLVLSVAQTLPGAAALKELAHFVSEHSVALAYGGGIFNQIPDLTLSIPGYSLGQELNAVPKKIESLLTHLPALPTPLPLSPEYAAALAGFKEKDALIIAAVNNVLQNGQINPRHLDEANLNFTHSIVSALALGDLRFLDHSVGWLDGLLANHGLSPKLAEEYYAVYRRAVEQLLGAQGQPIIDWLANIHLAGSGSFDQKGQRS
ncbi:MAG TPA: MerR family transcriptional regulator [Anaerolineales bacterium]|nr:MerR family transcriptional regulator [Anaerolineales bacterium]